MNATGNTVISYSIEEHRHKSAAWYAATSARASKLCRFNVETGVAVLEACGFTARLARPDQLPKPDEIDVAHREWRDKVISAAGMRGKEFTHGIAAKLINSYLKARFVCGGFHEHERVACLHPPVDRVLLKCLADIDFAQKRDEWKKLETAGWSNFSSQQYERAISLIRESIHGRPLWVIEEYWKGYQ